MEAFLSNSACHELHIHTLCQLEYERTGCVCKGFVNIGDDTLFSCGGDLHLCHRTREGHNSECIREGIAAIAELDAEHGTIMVLGINGAVVVLPSLNGDVDYLCDVVLGGDANTGETISNGDIIYDKANGILVLVRNELVSIHSLVSVEDDRITTETIASHRFDHPNIFCSLWGAVDSIILTCSGYSSDITTLSLKRTFSPEEGPAWRSPIAEPDSASPAVVEVVTKHDAWITAISRVASSYYELSATGDCLGTIIIWRTVTQVPRRDSGRASIITTVTTTDANTGTASFPEHHTGMSANDSVAAAIVADTVAPAIAPPGPGARGRTASMDSTARHSIRFETNPGVLERQSSQGVTAVDAEAEFRRNRSGSMDNRSRRRGSSMDAPSSTHSQKNHPGRPRSGSRSRSRSRSRRADPQAAYPVRHLLRSTALCEGNSISAILIDAAQSDLWVADVSGAITSAHLSVRSKSLTPTRRFMLFGTLGGPSFLSWTPTAAESLSAPVSGSGVLRAFSPASGTLVEVALTNNIEAVFRVSAPTDVKVEPKHLGANHAGRVSAAEVRVIHAPAVDVCAYFPHWNLVAVTSTRSRFIQLFDLYSGLLQLTIQTTEAANCKCLAAFDAPVAPVLGVVSGTDHTGAQREKDNMSTAWLAAGYSNGKFILYRLQRRNPEVPAKAESAPAATAGEAAKPAVEVNAAASSKQQRSRRISKAESHQSSSRRHGSHSSKRKPSRARTVSAQEVDILEAVGAGAQTAVEYGRAAPTEDDLSEASDGSLKFAKDEFLGNSDDDSVGGGGTDADKGEGRGEWRVDRRRSTATTTATGPPRRRSSSMGASSAGFTNTSDYRRASTAGTISADGSGVSEVTHTTEVATQFCPLVISDILFSTAGGFIAIVHIRKVVVVFNNQPDVKKMSLKVSFEEVLSDVRAMVPSEALAEGNDPLQPQSEQHRHRGDEDRGMTFTDRTGRRRSSFTAPTMASTVPTSADYPTTVTNPATATSGTAIAHTASTGAAAAAAAAAAGATSTALPPDDDSLILLLQFRTRVKLLDGIKGTLLAEFPLNVDDATATVSGCAAWDVPLPAETATVTGSMVTSTERAIAGVCVAQDLRVFLFGEESGAFRQHFLHDQTPPPALPGLPGMQFTTSLHTVSHVSTTFHERALTFPPVGGFEQSTSLTLHPRLEGSQEVAHPNSRFSVLDNLAQGLCVRELTAFSPLVCVWSMRRLALLRVQLVRQGGVEVLRTEEYCVSQDQARIVYASALKAIPRMRNHRALVVLSIGYVVVLHL